MRWATSATGTAKNLQEGPRPSLKEFITSTVGSGSVDKVLRDPVPYLSNSDSDGRGRKGRC